MKPRTKFEKAVIAQSGHLRPLATAPRRWAFRYTINHYAYCLPKGRTTCMDCGHSWLMSDNAEKCTCPNCKAKLEVKVTYVRKCQQKSYLNVIDTCGEYQLLRMFLMVVEMRKGFKASPAFLEIGQYWIAPNGKTALVAKQRTMGWYLDCFAFGSPMEIRKDNETYRHISDQYLYPKLKVIPALTRNGFMGDFHGIHSVNLFSMLLSAPQAETLMKDGNFEMLKYMANNTAEVKHFWASYIIARRHGYEIPNLSTWYDYLRMLERFGRDTRSPKLIAPDNLFDAHDEYVRKVNIQRERERREADRIKAMENETKFKELKGRFIGLVFVDNELEIKTLDSVDEYYTEGRTQHICVGTAQYYLKAESLVFSARIDGRIVATVEIDLKTLKVIQCRAACNKECAYQERIEKAIASHRKEIKARMTA
jgi:hypothetical protein